MTKIMAIITSSIASSDRDFCSKGDKPEWAENWGEWERCWWSNDSNIPKKYDEYDTFIAKFIDHENKDVLEINRVNKTQKSLTISEKESARYYLIQDLNNLKNKIENEISSESSKQIWVVMRNEKTSMLEYLDDVANRMDIKLLVAEHSVESRFASYSSTGAYWTDMMRLRYESIQKKVGYPRKESFTKVWRKLSNRKKENRFRTLKHNLSHLFADLKIDMETWSDSGFSDEYANEIEESYDDIILNKRLEDAKEMLYDDSNSIESIINSENYENLKSWKIVKNVILPKSSNELPSSWKSANYVIKGNNDKAKKSFGEGVTFSEWVKSLDKNLEAVRSAIFDERFSDKNE